MIIPTKNPLIAEWTEQWASAQSIDNVSYKLKGGISLSRPEPWLIDADGVEHVLMAGLKTIDDQGGTVALLSAPEQKTSIDCPFLEVGDVVVHYGWVIRITSMGDDAGSFELLATPLTPNPTPPAATPSASASASASASTSASAEPHQT